MSRSTPANYIIANVGDYDPSYLTKTAWKQLQTEEDCGLEMANYWVGTDEYGTRPRLSTNDDAMIFGNQQDARRMARELQKLYDKEGWEANWKAVPVRKVVTVSYEALRKIPALKRFLGKNVQNFALNFLYPGF